MANRYWVGGNANWDATAGTKWALTSGGAGGEAVPTSADAVFLDNGTGTGNVTIAAAAACASLNCTGYTGVLAYGTQWITAYGSVTFVSGQGTMTGTTGGLIVAATGTLTSGGKTVPNLKIMGTSQTYTLADDWHVGALTLNPTTGATVTGGYTIYASNGYATVTGTTTGGASPCTVRMTGGTYTLTGGTCALPLTFDGNVTIASGSQPCATLLLTYLSGTITHTGSLSLNSASAVTINTSGVTWPYFALSCNQTITFTSLFKAGELWVQGDRSPSFAGSYGFEVATFSGGPPNTNRTLTFSSTAASYTVTSSLTIHGDGTYRWTLQSDHATNRVTFVLTGATQSVDYVNVGHETATTRAGFHSNTGTPIICPNGTFYLTDGWSNSSGAPDVKLIYRAKASV